MSDTGKLIIAFFLGLAIALGSAFFFMRPSSQPAPAVAAAAPPAIAPAPAIPAISAPEPTPSVAEQPSPERRPKKLATAPKPLRDPRKDVAEQAAQTPPLAAAMESAAPPQPTQTAAAVPPPAPTASQPVFTPSPAPAPAAPAHTITLPSGTVLNVRLTEALTTDRTNSGDTFHATLTSPLVVDGFVIADRGSKVQGEVVSADRSGRVKGKASMTLALSEINTTDGQRVRVQTDTFNREAAGSKGSDAAKMAAGAGLGALIGGLAGGGKGAAIGAGAGGAAGTGVVLGTRGKEVNLPSETALTFRLTNPVTITEQFHN